VLLIGEMKIGEISFIQFWFYQVVIYLFND